MEDNLTERYSFLPQSRQVSIGILGEGYIGRHLADLLINLGFNVKSYNRDNIDDLCAERFDIFFNCAGVTGDYRSKPFVNINANISLSEYLISNLVTNAYVGLSSIRVYKSFFQPQTEVSLIKVNSTDFDYIYDGSKLLMESMILNIGAQKWPNIAMLRLSNVFGKFPASKLGNETLLKVIVNAALTNQKIVIKQNSGNAKDYISLDDALEGMIRSGFFNKGHEIYNLASGNSITLNSLVNKLSVDAEFNSRAKKQVSLISIEKAKAKLGFEPKFNIDSLSLSNMVLYE
jgi:nucleoside-diphosphate-sugar epimerase